MSCPNFIFLQNDANTSPWIQSNLDLWERVLDPRNILCIPEKQTVFYQGDPAKYIYVVQRGRIILTVISETGAEKILMFAGKGCIIGEQALTDNTCYTYQASTLEESCFYRVPIALFKEHLNTNKDVAMALILNQLNKCNSLTSQIAALSFEDAMKRLIRELLYCAEQYGVKKGQEILINKNLNQEDLGKQIHASRVTVNRLIGELENRSMLHRQGRKLILNNVDELTRMLETHEK